MRVATAKRRLAWSADDIGDGQFTLWEPSVLDAAELEEDPESAAAMWWLDSRRPSIYSQVQPDQPCAHRPKVGAWPSLCMGYDRPSPETGDDFRWTRCFVPGIGVIHITFDSVWGDLRCGLQRSLAHPSLP